MVQNVIVFAVIWELYAAAAATKKNNFNKLSTKNKFNWLTAILH